MHFSRIVFGFGVLGFFACASAAPPPATAPAVSEDLTEETWEPSAPAAAAVPEAVPVAAPDVIHVVFGATDDAGTKLVFEVDNSDDWKQTTDVAYALAAIHPRMLLLN